MFVTTSVQLEKGIIIITSYCSAFMHVSKATSRDF